MNEEKNKERMITIPEAALLDLVAFKLKGVDLFPELLQQAKDFLKDAKMKETE